jgi:hypothetical protein
MGVRNNDGLRTAAYWESLAEEARAKSDEMHDKGAKATMLSIAKSYDRLATQATEREQPPTRKYITAFAQV